MLTFHLLTNSFMSGQANVQYIVSVDQDELDMDTRIELRHLRYFVAVAEELHFSRAARKLNLAQPPLSQQIRQLEAILGYPLFNRTSRSVKLTPAGAVYLERTRKLLQGIERDIGEMRDVAQGKVGLLHIGFIGSAMLTRLPGVLRAYRESFPGVELRLHESFTAKVIEGLEDGSLDVGLLRDADQREVLHLETLFSEPFVAVVSVGHTLSKKKIISLSSLRDEPFVFYPRTAGVRAFEKPMSLCEAAGFRPRIVQVASNWLTILRLVGTGIGVSIAPASVKQIASPETVCIPLRGANEGSQMELAWRKGESRPMVDHFAQIARNYRSA
jgi:DNA-binding transcriptional LysR family regulator